MKLIVICSVMAALVCATSVSASCNKKIATEYPPPGESAAIKLIKEVIAAQQQNDHQNGHANRFFHAKGHGCLDATFTIDSDIPSRYAKGIFQPGKSWPIVIRMSNGQTEINPDSTPDTRGFAFKVLGVPGSKLTPDDPTSQDFILAAYETFFVPDATAVSDIVAAFSTTGIIGAVQKGKILLKYPRSVKAITLTALAGAKITNVLDATFWSQTPYLLGDGQAVKYKVSACNSQNLPGSKSGDNYLRETMEQQIYTFNKPGCFDFFVQAQQDACEDDIEDSMTQWSGPFVKIGTINIGAGQDFTTQNKQDQCENLSISPWHSIAEHRPLGINRIRKDIYEFSSTNRHNLNGANVYYPPTSSNIETANIAAGASKTPKANSSTSPVTLVAAIAGCLVVAAAIAALVVMKRNKKTPETTETLLQE